MISEERILKVLRAPHISEKSTNNAEANNTIVFKVAKDATKAEIKAKKDEYSALLPQYQQLLDNVEPISLP